MLCFWNNGTPRVIKNTRNVKMPNGDVVMGAKADPDSDVFEYVETGPIPGAYEVAGSTTYDNDGWTVTATRTVASVSLDLAVQIHKMAVNNHRNFVRDAGIEHGVYVVQTDGDSRRELVGAVVTINEGGLTEMSWRMVDNAVAVLSAADFKIMALAVSAHVQACYVRQAGLEADIAVAAAVVGATAADIAAIDVQAGWPAHYVAPGSA